MEGVDPSAFHVYEHEDVRIVVDKDLEVGDTLEIAWKPRFLFLSPSFVVRGVS